MLLISHIIIALLSLVLSGLSLISPGKVKLNLSYWSVALTLITGTFLVMSKPTHLAQSCLEGVLYLSVVSALMFAGKQKLIKN